MLFSRIYHVKVLNVHESYFHFSNSFIYIRYNDIKSFVSRSSDRIAGTPGGHVYKDFCSDPLSAELNLRYGLAAACTFSVFKMFRLLFRSCSRNILRNACLNIGKESKSGSLSITVYCFGSSKQSFEVAQVPRHGSRTIGPEFSVIANCDPSSTSFNEKFLFSGTRFKFLNKRIHDVSQKIEILENLSLQRILFSIL